MKIQFTEADLRTVICEYVNKMGTTTSVVSPEAISFTMSRSPTAVNAEVDLDMLLASKPPAPGVVTPRKATLVAEPSVVTEPAEVIPEEPEEVELEEEADNTASLFASKG